MKNKRYGFTLVELLGVITILAVLALIAVPTIDNILTKNKEKLHDAQIQTIKAGLKTWADNNALLLPSDGEDSLVISLGVLKLSGFVDQDIIDPETDKCFSNDMILSISAVKDGYSYYVDEKSGEGGLAADCDVPTSKNFLYLKGSGDITLQVGEQYAEPGFIAIDEDGTINNKNVTTIIKDKDGNVVSAIDTGESTSKAPYIITYTYGTITKTRTVELQNGDPVGTVYTFDYTGAVQNTSLKKGTYKLEVWGGSGGGTGAGLGGYATGNVSLSALSDLYIYVGGTGILGLTGGGFNGGGNPTYPTFYGGGGASDIRIGTNSLYARVIVAGGGGGFRSSGYTGGSGGGLSGILGTPSSDYCAATASTQISGGVSLSSTSCKTSYGSSMTDGSFGLGGSYISTAAQVSGFAGGGGGWYGGGGGHAPSGGSSWLYTASSFTTWQTGNAADAAKWLLNSSYYLSSASTIDGTSSMPTHDGTSTMTGNTGNGYIKITKVA